MSKQLIGLARAYPMINSFACFLSYFITGNIDLLLLSFFLLLNDSFNHFLKYKICKPLMGSKKWPILGYGTRPKGAKFCGIFVTPNTDGIPKNSYGMPSGHSQNAIFFSTYVILNLINSNYNYLTKVYGIILFTLAGVGIMYSRVYLKCHTVEQVIAGGLIGGILGALYFKNKDKIKKIIFG
jgi:membrane-associated phospholipid phosphatase